MPPHSPADYAAFLAQQLPLQQTLVAAHMLGGERLWLKRAGARHGMAGYRLLGWIARLARLPALRPVPNRGGQTAIATELQRLRTLAGCGLRVPQVLAACDDGFLMRDLGDGQQAAPSLSDQIEAALPHSCTAVLALWREGLATLDAVHAQGQCLSQAFARNLVRCADGAIACIDFEDDPAATLALPLCQVRDGLTYVHSTAVFLHQAGAQEEARRLWQDWLHRPVRSPAFGLAMQETVARLGWLRYLPPDRRWGRDAWRLRAAHDLLTKLSF